MQLIIVCRNLNLYVVAVSLLNFFDLQIIFNLPMLFLLVSVVINFAFRLLKFILDCFKCKQSLIRQVCARPLGGVAPSTTTGADTRMPGRPLERQRERPR